MNKHHIVYRCCGIVLLKPYNFNSITPINSIKKKGGCTKSFQSIVILVKCSKHIPSGSLTIFLHSDFPAICYPRLIPALLCDRASLMLLDCFVCAYEQASSWDSPLRWPYPMTDSTEFKFSTCLVPSLSQPRDETSIFSRVPCGTELITHLHLFPSLS